MKEIPLTQGLVALVDDEDFAFLNQYNWSASGRKGKEYAQAWTGPITRYVLMHRFLIGDKPGMEIDHIDRNPRNNCRSNLRHVTHVQNSWNRDAHIGTSGYRGVTWKAREKRWIAQIRCHRRLVYLGFFHSEIEAAKAYDRAALQLRGEFALLNFPEKS